MTEYLKDPNLRAADLIAKTARVTLKDTLRVLAALDAVAYHFDVSPTIVVEDLQYNPTRPNPYNIAACEAQFFAMREPAHEKAEEIATRLKLIKKLA